MTDVKVTVTRTAEITGGRSMTLAQLRGLVKACEDLPDSATVTVYKSSGGGYTESTPNCSITVKG